MIIITDQMKDAMNNDSVQLLLEVSTIFNGILPDTVNTDEKITGQSVSFTIIESDYICKIIMLKISLIYIKDIIVRAEYDIDVTDATDLAFCNKAKPAVCSCLSLKNKVCVFEKVRNHALKFSAKLQNVQKV